jgi:hypothetical protein
MKKQVGHENRRSVGPGISSDLGSFCGISRANVCGCFLGSIECYSLLDLDIHSL